MLTNSARKVSGPNIGEMSDSPTSSSSNAGKGTFAQSASSTAPRWYTKLNPLRWGEDTPVPDERTTCPEYGASLWSRLTFQWMTPLMQTGYRRPLELQDIWLVNPDRNIAGMASKFQKNLHENVQQGRSRPLLLALHDTFKAEFWIGGLCLLVASVCQVMSPFTLRYLIQFAEEAYASKRESLDHPGPPVTRGMGLVFGIFALQLIQSVGVNQFMYHGFLVGGQARAVLICSIFEKTMRMSGRARAQGVMETARKHESEAPDQPPSPNSTDDKRSNKDSSTTEPWSNGRILNMIATDTSRIDQACGMFHLVWTSPVTIILTFIILVFNLTYSAIAGFGLLILGLPALLLAMRFLITKRKATVKITDTRMSTTQEILKSIRFMRFYGWEDAFLQRLMSIRHEEILATRTVLTTRNGINAVSYSLPIFASMLSFITYSFSGHALTAARVFSSLALFNALRVPFNLLPVVVAQVTDAWTSVLRIQEFLSTEEQQDVVKHNPEADSAVSLHDAYFVWEQTPESARLSQSEQDLLDDAILSKYPYSTTAFSLNEMNLNIDRAELIAVIGNIGCGKTSLLAALAGDMRMTHGSITLGGSRAFCSQHAWIQNATLRENILFGKPMDVVWYQRVVHACALQPDFDMLPAGDMTEVGERGINLSGGQKQRLNLARAIYSDSNIVLLDDPLSAVDTHVGRHIFEEAICGLLSTRCRILATHQLHVLARCDRVIWLEHGRAKAIDTFANLSRDNEEFRDLMESITQQQARVTTQDYDATGRNPVVARTGHENNPPTTKLMQEEERAVSSISWSVYADYVKASGSIWNGLLPVILLLFSQGANIATSLWLSYWTSSRFDISRDQYVGIYVGLACLQTLLIFSFSWSLSILGTRSSRSMFRAAMAAVLRAPVSFFDTTPLGRIINRFSRDVDTMDNILTDALRQYMFTLVMITSVFILFVVFFHYSGIALGPMLLLFLFAAAYYRASARQVKRHEAVLRSTMFAKFSEAITGVPTIRAYGLQQQFTDSLRNAIDDLNSAYYLTFSNQRWLNTRLDIVSNLLVATTGILMVTLRFTIDPSISGLVFSYMLSIVQIVQLLVRQMAEVENSMNSTERLHHYGHGLDQEPDNEGTVVMEPTWPRKGEIKFSNVKLQYRPGLPLVLKGVDMTIAGGERVAIVGRTGAGKSSLAAALFRLTEVTSGQIEIDGIDIAKVPLQALRSRLSIIPQDPAIFQGTVRSNLDPFSVYEDRELWSALRHAHLADGDGVSEELGYTQAQHPPFSNQKTNLHLDSPIQEDGLNFSLGQRQLLALARALVRNSQVIICDEATSSVDSFTDMAVQETIRTKFGRKTLLFIAHRLKSVVRYDRVCVMDQGLVAELDTPRALWANKSSIFRGMCDESGIVEEDFNHLNPHGRDPMSQTMPEDDIGQM